LTQQNRTPATPTPSEAPVEPGQQEYQQAQAILRAPNREAELPNAVQLLWTSVEKGNRSAEIALAELYRTGRGVARNCAQAKILLSTAARKGSAEAQKGLEELQTQGCGD
jgi:TPR repeat protein